MEISPPAEIPAVANRAFIEYTYSEHGHGGPGWEFETCLWSPTKDAGGSDSYAVMREPDEGDLVIHVLDRELVGYSRVAEPFKEVSENPPNPGNWEGRPTYYRIELRDFQQTAESIPVSEICETYAEEIEREINLGAPKYFAFNSGTRGVRFNQQYLSVLTPTIVGVFNQALRIPVAVSDETGEEASGREDYSEGKRRLRETSYFARNPKLVRDAKEKYGYVCQVCGFDYGKAYGELGEGYIEVHHLNPLSERPETEEEQLSTNLDEVMVVCANCHRMLHRKSPALDPSVVKKGLSS
jgi:predicted HNH restriction endonuclease